MARVNLPLGSLCKPAVWIGILIPTACLWCGCLYPIRVWSDHWWGGSNSGGSNSVIENAANLSKAIRGRKVALERSHLRMHVALAWKQSAWQLWVTNHSYKLWYVPTLPSQSVINYHNLFPRPGDTIWDHLGAPTMWIWSNGNRAWRPHGPV